MQIRYFNEHGLDKLDKLMKFLTSKQIPFTAHWVGLAKEQLAYYEKKAVEAGREFDPSKQPLVQITWQE